MLLAITVLTPYFYYIPKSCLAGVIICAVVFMIEITIVKHVWRSRSKRLIYLIMFAQLTQLLRRTGHNTIIRELLLLSFLGPESRNRNWHFGQLGDAVILDCKASDFHASLARKLNP